MKKYVMFSTLLAIAIAFSYNIAYVPEIDTSSIGYDNAAYCNPFGDTALNNPASLVFVSNYELGFSYYDYLSLGLLNLQQFYIKQPLKNGFAGLLAVQRTFSNSTEDKFDNWIYDYRFASLNKNISFGMAIKYITLSSFYYTELSTDSNVSYITADIGIIVNLNKTLYLSALAKNFLSYKLNSQAITIYPSYAFSADLKMNNFNLEASLGKEFNESSYWGGGAIGIKLSNLTLRGGMRIKTDFSTYHLKDAGFGISLKISNIVISYAFKTNLITDANSLKSNFLTFSFVW